MDFIPPFRRWWILLNDEAMWLRLPQRKNCRLRRDQKRIGDECDVVCLKAHVTEGDDVLSSTFNAQGLVFLFALSSLPYRCHLSISSTFSMAQSNAHIRFVRIDTQHNTVGLRSVRIIRQRVWIACHCGGGGDNRLERLSGSLKIDSKLVIN